MNSSSPGRVTREKRGHILLLGLDRPSKRNAFDLALLNDLTLAYGEFERDDEARVALIFAHGEHFTAGLDLANIAPTFAAGVGSSRVDLQACKLEYSIVSPK